VVAVERAGELVEVLGEVLGHGFGAFRSVVLRSRWSRSAGRSPTRIETLVDLDPRRLTAALLDHRWI